MTFESDSRILKASNKPEFIFPVAVLTEIKNHYL